MSRNGGTMTRRQFNQNILPAAPPSKGTRIKKNKKSSALLAKKKVLPEIIDFFEKYIYLSKGKYVRKEMAKACFVSTQSISNWRHGTPPGRLSHTHIARYFGEICNVNDRLILAELEKSYHIGWQNWVKKQ